MRGRQVVLWGLLAFQLALGLPAMDSAPAFASKPPLKDPEQYLCTDKIDGKGVQCFHREADGAISALSGMTLAEAFRAYWISDRPVLYIDRDGGSAVAYMVNGAPDAMLYGFNPQEGPGMGLVSEPWWTDFWYALDDEFWVTFEQQIVREHGALLNETIVRTLDEFQNYEVSADMEDDDSFTLARVSGHASAVPQADKGMPVRPEASQTEAGAAGTAPVESPSAMPNSQAAQTDSGFVEAEPTLDDGHESSYKTPDAAPEGSPSDNPPAQAPAMDDTTSDAPVTTSPTTTPAGGVVPWSNDGVALPW